MLGERINGYDTALHFPQWIFTTGDPTSFPPPDDSSAVDGYSNFLDSRCYSPCEANDVVVGNRKFVPIDALLRSSDHFRMFEFKVRMCSSAKPHDWTECPFAHLGEKARRRDPRKFGYSGAACPDFRKGSCRRGYACEFAHGVFESWLHPARYRTQLCKDGPNCTRRVCFFAHSLDQLRVLNLNPPADGFPYAVVESPSSLASPRMPGNSVTEIVAYLVELQLNKVKSMAAASPPTITGRGYLDGWDEARSERNDQPARMERVESGMGLRARMFEKLSRENPLTRPEPECDLDFGGDYHW